ncbi:MAG: hypothetical protein Q9166_004500 [cf. Caloplaca sp. 2 TL-2023]
MRAESRAREASFNLDLSDTETPVSPPRNFGEPAETITSSRPGEAQTSLPPPEPLPASSLGEGRPTNLPAETGLGPAKTNGFSYEPPSVPPQSSATPQPQVYTTPEHQTRLLVRPMSVPVAVPLAVRQSPNSHHMQPAPNHVPRHQESANVPKTTTLKPLGFGPNEHIISLAMHTRVRDQYTSIINVYRDTIMKLMNSDSRDQACENEITKLLTRINDTLQHSDLDAKETLEETSQPSPEDEATWAEQCSFKFQFLRHFLEGIRHDDVHVSIVAQPGRLLDIIETFLKGRGIVYFRPDGKGASLPGDQRFAHCRCQVSIVPSGLDGNNLAMKPAALVIAFDGSVNAVQPQVYRMRVQQGFDWLQPVVRLVVYKSAEHLAICLPAHMNQYDRIRRIVSGMTQLRHEVGQLNPEDMEVSAAAEEVAIALRLGGHERRWTLPSIRALPLDFHESSRDSSTQLSSQLSQEQDVPFESSSLKRAWNDMDSADTDKAKRQRLSSTQSTSHITDSIHQPSQVDYLQKQNGSLAIENDNLKSQVNHLIASQTALEKQLATTTRTNQHLLSQTSITQSTHQTHISDLEGSLSSLQTRYEDKDRAYRDLQLSQSDLDASLAKATHKVDSQTTDLTSLKASKRQLEADLEQARKDLLSTSNPDLARIALAESAARDALIENELLKKKTATLSSDLEFTRTEYQTASTSAADLAAQVTSLTSQLEVAESKASGEATRLAQINKDNAIKEARKEIRQLKTVLEERERVCRRKEEEIVELKGRRGRGGVVTRGGSVQPGGVGQGKSPRGSRGGSPLPGVGVGVVGGEGMRRGGSGLRGEVV